MHSRPPRAHPTASSQPSPSRRRCPRGRTLGWLLVAGLAAGGALAQPPVGDPPADEQAESSPRPVEVARARVVGERPGHHLVRGLRRLHDGGGRLDWLRRDDWIAFDRIGDDGRSDVYLLHPNDPSSPRCLTCDIYDFRKTSVLSPAWHPSGELLAVLVQRHATKLDLDVGRLSTPYRGLHAELWIVYRDGRQYLQLTHASERGGAVLDAHFSHEGDRLAWSERVTNRSAPWGEWAVRVAELRTGRGLRLGKVRTYEPEPGEGIVMVHGFAPNDHALDLSALPGPGLPDVGLDVQILDLDTKTSDRLTTSPDERDLLLSHVPSADLVVWTTDRGIPRTGDPRLPWRGDLWLRSLSGIRQERLTFFNDPASDHYLGEALVADLAWSSDGRRLALQVVFVGENDRGPRQAIYLLEIAPLELGDEPWR